MRAIFAKALPVSFIFEAFGGIGKTAQVLAERFPSSRILAADIDEECVRLYNDLQLDYADCIHTDARTLLSQTCTLPYQWGVSLDFNRFTIMDLMDRREGQWKVDLIDAVVQRKPKWVQITDSAIRYLHLNYFRYGCVNPGSEEYIQVLSNRLNVRWGLTYQTHSCYYAASYLLLTLT